MSIRRYTHHAINGEYITLDDLELFAAEMKNQRGMPGTAAVRFRGHIELDFTGNGPRARTVTAEAEPSADDLLAEAPVRAGERSGS